MFHANGGTPAPATLTGVTDGDVTGMSGMPAPVRAGDTLEGWYANAELTGDKVESLPAEYAAGTANYYAKWTPGTVKFTFVANGGTIATTEMSGTVGTAVGNTNMPAATRSGWTLDGWYEYSDFDGSPVVKLPATWPAANVTYYAKWTANESKITFTDDKFGNNSEWVGKTDDVLPSSEHATLPAPTHDGWSFLGWFTANGETGENGQPNWGDQVALGQGGDLTKFPAGGVTYYAKWAPKDVSYVFVANWADHDTIAISGKTGDSTAGKSWPTWKAGEDNGRSGWTFQGWFDTNEASGGNQFTEPSTFEWNANGVSEDGASSTHTYYARWTANDSIVVFEPLNATASKPGLSGLPSAPTRWNGKTSDQKYTDVYKGSTLPLVNDETLMPGWKTDRLVPERQRLRQPAVARRQVRCGSGRHRLHHHLLRQVGLHGHEHVHLRSQPAREARDFWPTASPCPRSSRSTLRTRFRTM